LLDEFKKSFKNLNPVLLTQEAKMIAGKKFPLSMGIKSAKNETLLLTDADCLPASEHWMRLMQDGYDEGKEIVADGFYYGMVTFVEDNFNFCMLTPYLAKRPTYPKRNFAFGGFDTKTNKLFMFFNGVATTNNRKTAIQVYNSLLKYCEWEYPFLLPFAIKL
jgi:hypothetical protein